MVERLRLGWTVREVAEAGGVSARTVSKWRARHEALGAAGFEDRSSRPKRCPRQVAEHRVVRIVKLRQRRLTGWEIARRLRMPPSTVAAVLKRVGLARLSALEPPKPPPARYERERPGELVHYDIKPLGRFRQPGHRIHGQRQGKPSRGVGYEFVHVAIDDASRLAYAEVLPDQTSRSTVAFFERSRTWFRSVGIRRIERVMTDNGSCYTARRFRCALERRGVRHLRTRPYHPETNGKAERFIKTLLLGWAYKRPYRTSNQRQKALPAWLRYYNERRPHRSLGMTPPAHKLRLAA